MNKLYKFGYVTGIVLLIISIYFSFSLVYFQEKLNLFYIIIILTVVVNSIKYFINNTIYPYYYKIVDDTLIIKRNKKLLYMVCLDDIKITNGLFSVQKQIGFEIDSNIYNLTVDYDIFFENKNKRIIWYYLYIFIVLIIILSVVYIIFV